MQPYLDAIEAELRGILQTDDPDLSPLTGMLGYHLGWLDSEFRPLASDPGKRVRALLCVLACGAAGGEWVAALPAAAAVELVHNFSLIHDDIQDKSEQRRGRPALWRLWGLAQGINAGDALFVLAHLALDDLGGHPRAAAIHRVLDRASFSLTQGQFLDLANESRSAVPEEAYFKMIRGKTAALVAAASEIGALVATGDGSAARALGRFGEQLGYCFQITDDLLGLWGDPLLTGKSAETDILSRKKSLPVTFALNRPEAAELRTLYAGQSIELSAVPHILECLEQLGAREYAQQRAGEHYVNSIHALAGLHNTFADELRALASSVLYRVK